MSKRTAIVRKGLKYQKKSQSRIGGSWLPRYPMAAASRETAFRHVWHRRGGERKCWCTNWFAVGKIKSIIGDYGDIGDYGEEEYPDYCNTKDDPQTYSNDGAIKNYIGIRYEVKVCQGRNLKTYICLPSDFAEYAVGDKVIVFMRGSWVNPTEETPDIFSFLEEPDRTPGEKCQKPTCAACKGTKRTNPERVGEEAEGSYLIMPLEIEGVNEREE